MADMAEPKTVLHYYLQRARDALVWKLDGLSERDARLPRTPPAPRLATTARTGRQRAPSEQSLSM
jgi:hypothetical protein